MDAVYYYGQDGEAVDKNIKAIFSLDEKELRWSTDLNTSVYDFVGFVFKGKNILVVFPKHYYSEDKLLTLNAAHKESNHDIELLYRVITKYTQNTNSTAKAKSYIGAQDGYDSDYPFEPFFHVYAYYQKYGLYTERETRIVHGSSGKVSWKKTLEKSAKIVSDNNLIFVPLFVKKKNSISVFITDCMAFIIDHTIDTFHNFLSLKRTEHRRDKFDYLNNIDFVTSQLTQYKNSLFKDIHKQMIMKMIDFFNQYKDRSKSKGGKIHVNIKYFDKIWQNMVGMYLNKHFVSVDNLHSTLVFNEQQNSSNVVFNDKSYTDIDDSRHKFYIDVDHVAYDNCVLYIFDSKYYFSSNHLNYKQYSYGEILRYYYPNVKTIYNALLLPGNKDSTLHFSLNKKYAGIRTVGNSIIEHYLPTKKVMEDYIGYI